MLVVTGAMPWHLRLRLRLCYSVGVHVRVFRQTCVRYVCVAHVRVVMTFVFVHVREYVCARVCMYLRTIHTNTHLASACLRVKQRSQCALVLVPWIKELAKRANHDFPGFWP